MSSVASRQYPRIPLDNPASLSVVRHKGHKCDWDTLRVRIRTASCEGVGLAFEELPPESLFRRDKILLSLHAGKAPIEVPGQVAWSSPNRPGGLDVGIRLYLGLASAVSRQIYSSWVVSHIISLRDEVTEAGLELRAYSLDDDE